MAKFEIIKEMHDDLPPSVESLEVTVWGTAGSRGQEFSIGSGGNFNASCNFWVEIRYCLQGVPLFHTRDTITNLYKQELETQQTDLEKFINKEYSGFGYGDMLPETSILVHREDHTYTNPDGEEETWESYSLEVSADIGAIFGQSPPGERSIDIVIQLESLDDVLPFLRQLIQEFHDASQGRHPDPGLLPPGSSDWHFMRQLNQRAYDLISANYNEHYFDNPLLKTAFDEWLKKLPAGGRVLDAGCGHGDPVISYLLDKGFQPTGSDISPKMLERARTSFPDVDFWNKAITEVEAENMFDGICSFSSMLYLDVIDFFHAIHRLHRALKPGGLLFLYGYDFHPSWRGHPYHITIDQWMWEGNRGIEEAVAALQEHGYFKVLKTKNTTTKSEQKEIIERWRINEQKGHEEWMEMLGSTSLEPPDLSTPPDDLAYCYIVIAQKQKKKKKKKSEQ
jgi:SAM-dependent methyltransferase